MKKGQNIVRPKSRLKTSRLEKVDFYNFHSISGPAIHMSINEGRNIFIEAWEGGGGDTEENIVLNLWP
jgi:hypothetical protein